MSFRDVTRDAAVPVLRERSAGRRGAPRRRHEGARRAGRCCRTAMLALTADETARARARCAASTKRTVVTAARPAKGTPNLTLDRRRRSRSSLPGAGQAGVSARAGSEAAYAAAGEEARRSACFFVSCDLESVHASSGRRRRSCPKAHHFEMSIEEQAATLLADGLAFSSREPQLNVFATFAAFLEGIAREGFEMWRYQRNLTGPNEGLNVLMHFVARRRVHRPRSLLGLEPRLDQPRARLPAVPAPLLRAGRRAGRVRRRARRRRGLRRPHRRHPARQPAGADAGGRQDAAVERRRRVDAGDDRIASAAARRPRSSRSARRATSPAQASDTAGGSAARAVDVYVDQRVPARRGVRRRPAPGATPRVLTLEDGLIGTVERRPARLRRPMSPGSSPAAASRSITSASSIRRSRRRRRSRRSGRTTA